MPIWRRFIFTFDVARALSVGILVYVCVSSGLSVVPKLLVGIVCFLILAFDVEIQKSETKEWGIYVRFYLRGRASNKFMTLAEIAGIEPKQVIPHALQVYEHILTECAAGSHYFKKGADGILRPEKFFGEKEG